jgi:putative ABC transport system permease protein
VAAANPLVPLLLLVLLAVAVVSLMLALRHRLAFRVALRNVRRARSRTVLLLLGLLVGTSIISGSLIVGDTVSQLNLHYTYLAVGYNDETITNQSPTGSFVAFPYSVYSQLSSAMAGYSSIAGIAPEIVSVVQAYDRSTGVPQTNLNLIGVNGSQSSQLGSFVTLAGQSLAGPAPGKTLLDQQAAQSMNASAGNTLVLFGLGGTPALSVVQAVVEDNQRGAFLTGGVGGTGNVFVDLPTAQKLLNVTGLINYISVTNVGGQAAGATLSTSVSGQLNTSLAQIPGAKGLVVRELLRDSLATAQTNGSSLTTLFLVLGLFSIVAGAMLIVGIFVMLGEERKGEMGMLRAVGLKRRELVYAFYFEGLAYSAGSALAGTFLGVAVGFGLTYAFSVLLSSTGLTGSVILQSFTVTVQTLVLAYVLGFLLTIVTVALASRRASRLNIVRDIRDVPEPKPPVKVYTYLAYVGIALFIVGILVFLPTYRGSTDISEPIIGGALAILGAALIGSRFVINRIVFSVAGAAFLLWAGFEPLHTTLLGTSHAGGIFIVFVEGIIMVMGALLLYVFNAPAVAQGLARLAGGRSQRAPVSRVAFSYPGRQPTRTTINLSIFALVIFTLVAIATFGATIQANLNNTVQIQSGGYSFYGFSTTPIPNFPGQVKNNTTLAAAFSQVVPLISGGVEVNVTGFANSPFGDAIYAAPLSQDPFSSFYFTNHFPFSSTWHGMSVASVMAQLQSNRSVAIVDQNYAPTTSNVGGGPPSGTPHPATSPGGAIRITNPVSGNTTAVTVIGILKESFVTGIWVNPSMATALGYHPLTAYFLTVSSGVSTTHAAQLAKAAFFPWGLVLLDFQALLSVSLSTTEGFIGLLQIFVGLGLAVGIAAMGIVAVRAVVERRREIGMLRANGFTQRMILKAFLLEYSFVALLGIAIGVGLGLLIVFNLSLSPSANAAGVATFAVPWTNLLIILGVAYALALSAVAGPSLRAARLPPAEAVRPTE